RYECKHPTDSCFHRHHRPTRLPAANTGMGLREIARAWWGRGRGRPSSVDPEETFAALGVFLLCYLVRGADFADQISLTPESRRSAGDLQRFPHWSLATTTRPSRRPRSCTMRSTRPSPSRKATDRRSGSGHAQLRHCHAPPRRGNGPYRPDGRWRRGPYRKPTTRKMSKGRRDSMKTIVRVARLLILAVVTARSAGAVEPDAALIAKIT